MADVRFDDRGTPTVFDDLVIVSQTSGGRTESRSFLRFNPYSQTPLPEATKIEFSGRDGHDTFRNSTDIPSTASGGRGNDTLNGGSPLVNPIGLRYPLSGKDVFDGGDGLDTLVGNGGSDLLIGGNDGDTIRGGAGSDTLDGGQGVDSLFGDADGDTLRGGSEGDELRGGDGNDSLLGDDGNDRLFGEGGRDTLQGGNNDDFLDGGREGLDDILFGNQGFDRFVREQIWLFWWTNRDEPQDKEQNEPIV